MLKMSVLIACTLDLQTSGICKINRLERYPTESEWFDFPIDLLDITTDHSMAKSSIFPLHAERGHFFKLDRLEDHNFNFFLSLSRDLKGTCAEQVGTVQLRDFFSLVKDFNSLFTLG
ncbi:hypothetical protein AVEN_48774-1 [Araneus ventricosus]|uniref:Uncharacterized protein n=1 Tax=Araneus ventricosus TaxID=182803 RepID=A0A4Y2XEF6_ARAVE|nr:hypothetical protein AVEN_48774-1 [Araneus ventricosus]